MSKRGEREPRPIGDLLPALTARRGWRENMALGRLRADWTSLVGEAIASRSEPVKLAENVLTIRCEGGAWSAELTLLASAIAAKCDSFLGGGAVERVEITSGSTGGRAPSR